MEAIGVTVASQPTIMLDACGMPLDIMTVDGKLLAAAGPAFYVSL